MADAARAGQLVDDLTDCYVAWREGCDTVRAEYEAWRSGAQDERTRRFAAYNRGLDREERAATLHAERIGQVCRFLWPDLETALTTPAAGRSSQT